MSKKNAKTRKPSIKRRSPAPPASVSRSAAVGGTKLGRAPSRPVTAAASGPERFRPRVLRNAKTTASLFAGLCKSCGECVVKCPVKCISWDKEILGQLGDPAITIDMNVCIGCETCEQICPDCAVEITNRPVAPKP